MDIPFLGARAASSLTALRLEGPDISVTKRKSDLRAHFANCRGEFDEIAPAQSRNFWHALRDCAPLAKRSADIWRVSTAPTMGAEFISAVRQTGMEVAAYYDWAGGLIWLATEADAASASSTIRTTLKPFGGHATLIRSSKSNRESVQVFQPQPTPLAALTARVKNSFDPERVLNRGRMRKDL